MMTARQAVSAGLRAAWRAKWMVFLFYGANLLLAAAVAAPMHVAIREHLGNSGVAGELARGFSASWLTEFQLAYAGFLRGFSLSIVYAGVLFLVLNAVLSAGAYEVFTRGEGARMHAFGRGLGKFFFRFLRLAALASFFYFVVFAFWNWPVYGLLEMAFRNSVYEAPRFYLEWLRWTLLIGSVLVVNAAVEYAKAAIVAREYASATAALGHGAGFVLGRCRRVMAIYLGVGALTLGAILVYAVFARYFPQSSVPTVLVWFLVAQALLWLRWLFRLASWGAAVEFYLAHQPQEVRESARAAAAPSDLLPGPGPLPANP